MVYLVTQAPIKVHWVVHNPGLCDACAAMAMRRWHGEQAVPQPPYQHHVSTAHACAAACRGCCGKVQKSIACSNKAVNVAVKLCEGIPQLT